MSDIFESLRSRISHIAPTKRIGRVAGLTGGTLRISGLSQGTSLGDRVLIHGSGPTIGGEVLRLTKEGITVLPDGSGEGLAINDTVEIVGRAEIAPDNSWIGRIIDPFGQPIDGRPLMPGPCPRALRAAPPAPASRRALGDRLETGTAVFNTLLPLVRGQRIGLFAGSGVGKSSLLGKFARGVNADVVVIALVGERGRELREFTERVLGPQGMARAVVVTATSDQSPLVRRRCMWTAMAVAEHFRDTGHSVMLFVDSVTRFCEAHREIAVASGESSALRGYPASTAPTIAGLCERAGPGHGASGDITAVFSVLVAGSDMEEPVADMLRGVLDGHVVLSRDIAERGRFPAVDLLRSVSRSLPDAAKPEENATISRARTLLGRYANAELMVQSGLYTRGTDPAIDAAIDVHEPLDAFLTIMDGRRVADHFAALNQVLGDAS